MVGGGGGERSGGAFGAAVGVVFMLTTCTDNYIMVVNTHWPGLWADGRSQNFGEVRYSTVLGVSAGLLSGSGLALDPLFFL